MFTLKRKFKRTTTALLGVVALGSFVALAVWGWGLPVYAVRNFFLICLLFLVLILILACLAALIIVLLKKLKGNNSL
ncbi:hypothetical protein [Sessilibacter corallicola]|uniref:hypothetical protein n=1 Tax=Sessilibacter corallicola TaxID=2904075 RepID=UPI00333E385A